MSWLGNERVQGVSDFRRQCRSLNLISIFQLRKLPAELTAHYPHFFSHHLNRHEPFVNKCGIVADKPLPHLVEPMVQYLRDRQVLFSWLIKDSRPENSHQHERDWMTELVKKEIMSIRNGD